MECETTRISIDYNEYMESGKKRDICEMAAIHLEIGCPHVIVTDKNSGFVVIEVDYKNNKSCGLLVDIWGEYCERNPHTFDELEGKRKNKDTATKWLHTKQ